MTLAPLRAIEREARLAPSRRSACRSVSIAAPTISPRFGVFLAAKREAAADVERWSRGILAEVMARGDAALVEFTRTFDRTDVDAGGLRVTPQEIERAVAACAPGACDALAFARDRIEAITAASCPVTIATPTRWASSSVRAGPRSRPQASMCRAAPRPIRPLYS